jgi:hypothetical protein
MPFLFTKGFSSSEGYKSYHKKVLTTYTFPGGTSTFTIPQNVTSLVSVIGQGGSGTSDSSFSGNYNQTFTAVTNYGGPYNNPPYADWSSLYSAAVSTLNAINSGAPASRPFPSGTMAYKEIIIIPSNYWNGPIQDNNTYIWGNNPQISGTMSLQNYGSVPTSGPITCNQINGGSPYTTVSAGWYITTPYTTTLFGYGGADSTGFGYTFPGGAYSGGAGYGATPVTYNNVSVNPSQTYTVVNNGSVTITYYT